MMDAVDAMMSADRKEAVLEILRRRYARDEFNVLHQTPRNTLLDNLSALMEPRGLAGKTILEIGAGGSAYIQLFLDLGVRQYIANDLVAKRLQLNSVRDLHYDTFI